MAAIGMQEIIIIIVALILIWIFYKIFKKNAPKAAEKAGESAAEFSKAVKDLPASFKKGMDNKSKEIENEEKA